MLSLLAPNLHLTSVLELDTSLVRQIGLGALLLDVDCTLKDHGATDLPEPVGAWIKVLQADGIRLCLLSNGKPRRIGELARRFDLPFVAMAFKPLPLGCLRAVKQLGIPRGRVGVVGDQLFADVLAGRLARLFTILVRPTTTEEPWFTRLKRPVERRVLRWIASPQPLIIPARERPL